jgi:phosphoribosylanthranilate isomerase
MTKIKICGINSLADARAAIEAGADYLGFNFYPKSVRFIERKICAEITSILRTENSRIKLVGVFVNSPVEEVKEILDTCSLDLAQLHGDESPQVFALLAPRAFRAFRGIPESTAGYERKRAPALLVDADVNGFFGGSGVVADWSSAGKLAKEYPLLLAGGLTPENVGEAIRTVKPWGVDVASGVELAPGKKDAQKIEAFVQAVKQTTGNGR